MIIGGTYFRWTRCADGMLTADILGPELSVVADPNEGRVKVEVPDRPMSPDEARLIGVRMIEAAALADGERAIRK